MALPNIPDILALLKRGKANEVVPMLERLARLMPASVTVHVLLARAHEARGDDEAALACWQQASFLMPNSPVIREELQQAMRTVTAAAPSLTVTEWVPDAPQAPSSEPDGEAGGGEDEGPEDEWSAEAAPAPPAWKKVDVVSAGGSADRPGAAKPPAEEKPGEKPAAGLPGISLGMPTPVPPKRDTPRAEALPPTPGPDAPSLDLSDPDLPELDVSAYDTPTPEMPEAVEPEPELDVAPDPDLSDLPTADDLPRLETTEEDLPDIDVSFDLPAADEADWELPDLDEDVQLPPPAPPTPPPAETSPSKSSSESPAPLAPQQEELPFDDLDRLIEDLEAARIVPSPEVDEIDAPSLEDEADDMVSETLARIYAAQQQYDEAARIYELLAAQQPTRAAEYRQKAIDMRSRASDE